MKTISLKAIEKIVMADESIGYCLNCGKRAHGVEPDASNYLCKNCGKREVFGTLEILQKGMVH